MTGATLPVLNLEQTLVEYESITYISLENNLRRRGSEAWPLLEGREFELAEDVEVLLYTQRNAQEAGNPPINLRVNSIVVNGFRLAKHLDRIACLKPQPQNLIPRSAKDSRDMMLYAKSLVAGLDGYPTERPKSAKLAKQILERVSHLPQGEPVFPDINIRRQTLRQQLWSDVLKIGFMAVEVGQTSENLVAQKTQAL